MLMILCNFIISKRTKETSTHCMSTHSTLSEHKKNRLVFCTIHDASVHSTRHTMLVAIHAHLCTTPFYIRSFLRYGPRKENTLDGDNVNVSFRRRNGTHNLFTRDTRRWRNVYSIESRTHCRWPQTCHSLMTAWGNSILKGGDAMPYRRYFPVCQVLSLNTPQFR